MTDNAKGRRKRGDFKFFDNFNWYVPGVGQMFILLLMLLVGAVLGNLVTLAFTLAGGQEAASDYDIKPKETLPELRQHFWEEIRGYLKRKESVGRKKGTLTQYKQVLRDFCLATPKKIQDVTEWDIRKFLDTYQQQRGIGNRRKDSMLVKIKGFFRYMSDTGVIALNPAATIEPIRYKKSIRRPLTPDEYERFKKSCRTQRERALVTFIYATGCRVSEVEAANKEDIDYGNRSVLVMGKGDKERFVYMDSAAAIELDDYFKQRTDFNPALFVSDRYPHERLSVSAIQKIIKEIGKRAGINRRVFPHLIRHTMATHRLNKKMPLEVLQTLLGHESADTTRIYAKDNPRRIQLEYMMTS